MSYNKYEKILTREFLLKELETKTITSLSKELNIQRDTVYYWVRKYKIQPTNVSENLSNRKFGMVKVIKYIYGQRKNNPNSKCWQCLCDCGNIVNFSRTQLFKKKNLNCGCQPRLYKGRHAPTYKGYESLSGSFFKRIKEGALKRKLEFNITKEYLWNLYLKQNKKCALSGVDINILESSRFNCQTQTASLDRIDSSKGYIISNVQWVHYRINTMKNNMSDNELINWCQTIINYQNKKLLNEL